MLNVPSQAFPASGSQQRAASQGRSKVPLKQGRSLMDWIRLTKSGKDLTGLKGRLIEVTEEELKKHNKKDDCWICIRGLVYNVSPYMEYHPGGEDELMRASGADGTDLFDQVHRWVNYESMLKECLVGRMAVKPSVPKETEGILQKLQRSVEQEENKWKIKVDESQKAIKQMQSSFTSSEQELEQLRGENKDIENLRRERELLKMELEKAKIEQATCVTEVRQLKTQLNETLTKLKNVQRERKKVADDLHKAQQSLNFIHSKISINASGDTAVTENSDISPEMESPEKETVSTSLNQTVAQLQQLLWEVNQQLTKEK